MTLAGQERDEIVKALRRGTPAAEVARSLIFPLNDVLTVQQELAGDRPAPNRTHALQPPAAIVVRPCPPDPGFPSVIPSSSEPAMVETPPCSSERPDVFTRAEQIDDDRIAAALRAATQARDLLVELVDGYDAQADVRARIAALKEQLAAEEAKLQPPAVTPAAPVTSITASVSAREIRAWADSHGIAVPPKGPVPKSVSEQYFAAQQVAV